ncbi:folylpolyglutamate synthase isoform X2 [Cryptomeria japonica]|uniref:folylpolyglutamate synthase isoform X2 n=1 Tax=Cryptomeria japonica TaxID=3369 RepID=UPI0025ABBBF0|nr:folylpolyglutamate synthase isoform X2 [Cryptomeria japonica]
METKNKGSSAVALNEDSSSPSSYAAAIDAISSTITRRKRVDNTNVTEEFLIMFEYLKILDLEESLSRLNVIHVAGTKGKGSTCAFTESILRACGYRTGLFTSPHLIDICERFRLNGSEIDQETFLKHFWWCWHRLKDNCTKDVPMPNYFRLLTLVAFKIFAAEKVDVAILEVGLGGKYDATNVVKSPVVCGIASLGFDHMEILGNTLSQIAGEKAGIFKPGVPAITVPQPEEAMEVLKDKASEISIPLQVALPLRISSLGGFKLGLAGDHQYINAGLAVALCHAWLRSTGHSKDFNLLENVDDGHFPEPFIKGLTMTNFLGRGQIILDPNVRCSDQHDMEDAENVDSSKLIFYLDGAHSPESMEACAIWFSHAIKDNTQSITQVKGAPNLIQNDNHHLSSNFEQQNYSSENYRKNSKQILIFNCMAERDPQLLLPHLVDTCALHGVHFHGAFFVPNQLSFTQVGSSLTPAANDSPKVNLSWQLVLQRTWENLINRGKETNDRTASELSQMPPSYDFFLDETSQESYHNYKNNVFSAVMPSLPTTIKWLRECVQQNSSVRLQVLVTGSLHLIGDVIRMLKK